jgi:hypothetical protein
LGKLVNFIEQTNKTTKQGPKTIQIKIQQNKTSSTRGTKFEIDHCSLWLCVLKLVNGLLIFFQKLQQLITFFSTKFAINHQILVLKLVNGLQHYSRSFSDRSPFFSTKFTIDHRSLWLCVLKLVNGLQHFSRSFSDRSPNLGVKTCKWPSTFSRSFSDRSPFFSTKFAIDHSSLWLYVLKLVNGLQHFFQKFQRSITIF